MSDRTNIAWTDATWNPWYGCTKVSAGCDNCYMFREQRLYGRDPEVVTRSKTKFGDPLRWKDARRVFTCSWSDWFHKDADAWRDEAWEIVRQTPQHTFQILTKRPGRILRHLPHDWGDGYANVWLGVSVENQEQVFRAEQLSEVPALIRFISAEPLIGPLSFDGGGGHPFDLLSRFQWVIVGGESGPDNVRREMDLAWAEQLRRECSDTDTAFFFKQRSGPRSELIDGVPESLLVREWPSRSAA